MDSIPTAIGTILKHEIHRWDRGWTVTTTTNRNTTLRKVSANLLNMTFAGSSVISPPNSTALVRHKVRDTRHLQGTQEWEHPWAQPLGRARRRYLGGRLTASLGCQSLLCRRGACHNPTSCSQTQRSLAVSRKRHVLLPDHQPTLLPYMYLALRNTTTTTITITQRC